METCSTAQPLRCGDGRCFYLRKDTSAAMKFKLFPGQKQLSTLCLVGFVFILKEKSCLFSLG